MAAMAEVLAEPIGPEREQACGLSKELTAR